MRSIIVLVVVLVLFGCSKGTEQGGPSKKEASGSSVSKEDAAQRVFGQIDGSKKILKK